MTIEECKAFAEETAKQHSFVVEKWQSGNLSPSGRVIWHGLMATPGSDWVARIGIVEEEAATFSPERMRECIVTRVTSAIRDWEEKSAA